MRIGLVHFVAFGDAYKAFLLCWNSFEYKVYRKFEAIQKQ